VNDWFDGDGRTDAERRFLAALRDRAQSWHQLGITPDHTHAWTDRADLYVHVDIADHAQRRIIGTLRVDFDGERVAGHWGAADFCDTIDPRAPDSFGTTALDTPEAAADRAASWLEEQLHRPIERREWRRDEAITRCVWVLADTDRPLCGAGPGLPFSAADGRWWQGAPPPTGTLQVTVLRPPRQS
jgi:hypothetical protein